MAHPPLRQLRTWTLLASLACASPAFAQPPSPPGASEITLQDGVLVIPAPDGSQRTLDPGCDARHVLRRGELLYVACGGEGVVVIDVGDPSAPERVGRMSTAGEARNLFEHGDRVWVEVERVEAEPVRATEPPAAGAGRAPAPSRGRPAPAAARSTRTTGTVQESSPGAVVIDLGAGHGLGTGDRIELYERDEGTIATRRVMRDRTLAIGTVDEIAEDRALVRLGFAERVPRDARARPTDRPATASLVAPPRAPGILSLEGTVRPFVPLGDLGFGLLGGVTATYRGERDWYVRGQLDPLGFGVGKDQEDMGLFAAHALAGYDQWLFAIGLGLGGMVIQDGTNSVSGDQTALSLVQNVRFGALDGLHLEATASFVLADTEERSSFSSPPEPTGKKFKWGSVLVTGQVPITRNVWLIARSGGGRPGHIFFDAGLRIAVAGNGRHGSVFLTPTLGGIWLTHDPTTRYDDSDTQAGPSVGLGVEWRP